MNDVPTANRRLFADEAAARSGEWFRAVNLKMVAIWEHAVELLEAEGVLDEERLDPQWIPESFDGEPNDFWATLFEDGAARTVFVASAGLRFIRSRPTPIEPWPPVYFAAVQVIDLWQMLHQYRRARRRDIQGCLRDDDIAELVWLSMRIGAHTEGFRPEYASTCDGLAEARRLLQRRKAGGRRSGGKVAEEANSRWRNEALVLARRERARLPHLGQKRLADRICDAIPDAPDRDQVVSYIRRCEARNELQRSTGNRSRVGEES